MLQHMNLLLKWGGHCCPFLELKVMLLTGMLEVYDHMGVLIHQLARCI
jgi:hypothetical protein